MFGATKIEYLGHLISRDGVSTDNSKIEAVLQWPSPRNVKQLRGFLGLTGYYRRFDKGYGILVKPLTSLLQKDKFEWSDVAEQAFNNLKLAMTSTLVLALPDFT